MKTASSESHQRLSNRERTRKGYRYDGLYTVTNYFKEQGISGFYVYRYELVTT